MFFHKTVKITTCLITNSHQHKDTVILLWIHYLDMIVCSEQQNLRKLQQSSQAIVRNFKSAGSSSLSLVSSCNLQYLCKDNILFFKMLDISLHVYINMCWFLFLYFSVNSVRTIRRADYFSLIKIDHIFSSLLMLLSQNYDPIVYFYSS